MENLNEFTGTFNDVVKGTNADLPMVVPNDAAENLNTPADTQKYGTVTKMVLQNMSQTKLLHWQCKLYGQHKALDKLFGNIIEIGDTLIETIMGKYGRPVLSDADLTIKLYNFENPDSGDLAKFMDDLYKCYRTDCRTYFNPNEDSELLNIVDEMIAAVDQTKYLISLR